MCATTPVTPGGKIVNRVYNMYANFKLQHAKKMQHAFSTDSGPTLHAALPALEMLHKPSTLISIKLSRPVSTRWPSTINALQSLMHILSPQVSPHQVYGRYH